MKLNTILYICWFFFICLFACGQKTQNEEAVNANEGSSVNKSYIIKKKDLIDPAGTTISTRIHIPEGYQNVEVPAGSFQAYLRELPLKPHGAKVKYYDGRIKSPKGVYIAVVDLEIGKKDLHQCADALMRLRAEYLWKNQKYDRIHFNFTNGFRVDYAEWMKGKRIVVNGNKTRWSQHAEPSNTYSDLWNYLQIIFSYAGTLSLSKEMEPVSINDLNIGDVFIQGGSPGHAVIVVNAAKNPQTGEKIFLLAQSYMPAQEIQVLVNPADKRLSPWYTVPADGEVKTPEWDFKTTDLKRFAQ
jgi:hypothetical protein